MNLTTSLDQIWRSPNFPMWLMLGAAGFFAVIFLISLLRSERALATGAMAAITLIAVVIAAAATIRGFSPAGRPAAGDIQAATAAPSLPALSCIDDLAGETALNACEKILFGSPDSVAAAVAYASALISRLTSVGDIAANSAMTPELNALRRSVERDRYGLMAYVLSVRDRCQPADCPAYQSLTDHNQIAANMDERLYEGTVARYAASWGAPAAPSPAIASLSASIPTGKPTDAEFPTAASIPPVNIMTPEPPLAAPSPPPPRSASGASTPAVAASAKKQAAPRPRRSAPVQLAPAPSAANE